LYFVGLITFPHFYRPCRKLWTHRSLALVRSPLEFSRNMTFMTFALKTTEFRVIWKLSEFPSTVTDIWCRHHQDICFLLSESSRFVIAIAPAILKQSLFDTSQPIPRQPIVTTKTTPVRYKKRNRWVNAHPEFRAERRWNTILDNDARVDQGYLLHWKNR
jgi:hypothetical protein